jgi:rfaE bifunctional protein nucleotidyltransferase chain/domain
MSSKIVNLKELKKILTVKRKEKKKVAFTNGCFDILHYGHVKYLTQAKKMADILVVGVNTDSSVKKIKGKKRPINPLKHRMEVLAGLEAIDYLISFKETTPYRLIKEIKPDVLIKGGDWKPNEIVGKDIVEAYRGKVITLPYIKGVSTTNLIRKIVQRFG